MWQVKVQLFRQRLKPAIRKAVEVVRGPQRRTVLGASVALLIFFFLLRGGLTPSPPSMPWPWPVGSIRAGETTEPYLFIVVTPRYLLTFQPYTLLRWTAMGLLFGWALAMLREAATRKSCRTTGARAGVGLLGGIMGVVGAGACCGSLLPAALAIGGLGAYAGALDWLSVAVWVGVILWQGDQLAKSEAYGDG